jgi:hypothetical protein
MGESVLLRLAQDLEWLGCELEYFGHLHAQAGFPEAGPAWDTFREKQRGVLTTVDKIERELKNAVGFNPSRLVGVNYPIEDALDSITLLLAAVENIKQSAMFAVHELPPQVRQFTGLIEQYLKSAGVTAP